MFEYPGFFGNMFELAIVGLGIFSFIVMIVVFQAAIEAKEYFQRKNHEHRTRPIER